MSKPHVLMTGLVIGESPRWHDGRLWFANWGAQEIIAVDGTGRSELIACVPTTIPFSIDWLPDGRLLVVSGPEARLLRLESDGAFVEHVDTSGLAVSNLNEIVVDGPMTALALVDELDLGQHHVFHAVRADLLRRLGRDAEAAAAYEAAIDRAGNASERDFLRRRRAALSI